MKFIKLTNEFNEEVFINSEHIVKFSATKNVINQKLTGLTFTSGFTYFIKETPEEIMEMNKEKAETSLENYQALSELYGNMRKELARTRKALDVAICFIKGISQTAINDCDNQYVVLGNFKKFAQDTLNQIKTALEQKDK